MSRLIANARMYAVTAEAEAAWRALLARVSEAAGLAFDYVPHPAPRPLEELWSRADLGCVLMCGYPIAMGLFEAVPIAAPVPAAPWAEGRAVYRTDLIVGADSPWLTLADSFRGRLGWTVSHSHSGFNALRYQLLRYRTAGRPTLYADVKGDLVTARRVLDSVLDGTIDVGPLDAYWHMLIRHYRPDLAAGVRVVESTETAPMPAFVAAPAVPRDAVGRLKASFAAASGQPWFPPLAKALLIDGFLPVTREDFAVIRLRDAAATRAGYPLPA